MHHVAIYSKYAVVTIEVLILRGSLNLHVCDYVVLIKQSVTAVL